MSASRSKADLQCRRSAKKSRNNSRSDNPYWGNGLKLNVNRSLRVHVWGTGGREFKSPRSDQFFWQQIGNCNPIATGRLISEPPAMASAAALSAPLIRWP